MDVLSHNRASWDKRVDERNRWTLPVTTEVVELAENGNLEVRHRIPYSDFNGLSDAGRRRQIVGEMRPMEFAHTLADQIGGQLEAGFMLAGFFEDRCTEVRDDPISRYIDTFIATRAIKP